MAATIRLLSADLPHLWYSAAFPIQISLIWMFLFLFSPALVILPTMLYGHAGAD